MKKSGGPLFTVLHSLYILFLTAVLICCQTGRSGTGEDRSTANDDLQADTLLKTKQLADNVWHIDESGAVNMYLVTGQDSALLIDTGTGAGNLLECVRSITSLPLIVVNTHGHPDHAGSNYRFEKIFAHPGDFDAIRQFSNTDLRPRGTDKAKRMVLEAVGQGYVFDLGMRKLEVIEVPGHTMGSICLLDRDHRTLYTGDNNNSLVWLFLEGCTPLETYLQSLEKLMSGSEEFDTLMPGHGVPLDADFIGEQIICIKNILDGSCEGEPYESLAGEARVCYYKRAGVAYDPDNLFAGK